MTKISKRLLALVLTAAMLLSCISTTVFAAEDFPNEPLHNHSEQSDLDDLAFVNGTACYVQYDLNNDGVLSGKDAVELLGRATMSDIYQGGLTEEYDLDKDGDFDADDALALLKIALWHPEDYKGNIHAFSGNPVWSWNDNGEAVAEFKCACGEKTARVNATLQEPEVKEATCTEAGFVKTTASVEFLGNPYEDTKTVIAPATGHIYTAEASCTESAECSKCGYVLPAAGHNYEKTAEQSASCTTEATETYTCKDCGDEYTVKTGDMVHTYVYDHEELKEGETCVYVRKLKCTSCGAEIDGEEAYHHKYKASITEEATCSKTGVKTYTCTECSDAYTEVILVSAEGHDWKETDTQNGVVNYKCDNCQATKSVVVADNNKVDVTALENGGEVQLDNNVSVTLDQKTTEQLNGQLTLNVSEVEDKDSINIDDQYKNSSTIYSLTMSDDTGSVTKFEGEVTVRLPYTLQEGDDVDCIKVLYVNDAGEVKEIEGHYSNGYVIFTTNHFSYYTVTRLTPAQRCALYGHNDKVTEVEATCENGGYTVKYCARCTRVEKTDETAALGHDYTVTESKATCTEAGSKTKECSRCDSALTENYPAIGHNWETETVAATCTAPGKETKTCNVCGKEQAKVLPQLEHKITDTVVPPTCTDNGYTLHKCADCDYSATDSAVAAKGHTYKAEWVWDESNYSAKVTLTCTDCGDTVTADAAVAEVVDLATCTEGGTEAFEASYSHAGKVYTDSINIKLDPLGHDFGDWEDNGENHIHICGRCEAEETEDHIWDEGKITKEPTCGTEGNIRKNCRVCSVKKDFAIPATGEHNFEDGICTECGYNENDCNHYSEDCEFTEIETVDLSKHGFCGGILHIKTCDCGLVHRDEYEYTDICCKWNWESGSDNYDEKPDGSGYISEDTFTCYGCGAVRTVTYDITYVSEDSCDAITVNTATYRSVTGEEFSISEQNYYEDCHRIDRKFEMLGSSCGEGVLEQGICEHCGKVLYEETYYEHNTDANVERIILPDSTCGGEYYIYSCACGQVMECENCECCNWNEIKSDEEAEIFTHKCDECNTVMVVEYGEEECDDCHGSRKFYVTMFNPSGEKIFDRTFEIRGLNHNFETVIALNGESCEDGYTVTKTCSKCGTVESFESNAHNTSILDGEIIDLSEHGFCGGILHIRTCPCGEVHGDYYEYTEDVCHWEWNAESYTEKEDGSGYILTTKKVCYSCGAVSTEVRDVTYYSAEDCYCHTVVTTTYRNADGEEFIINNEFDDYDHNIEQEYTLLGESCEDGVTYKEICRHCGKVLSENRLEDHSTVYTETIELPDTTCGGYYQVYTCACGKVSNFSNYSNCYWISNVYDEENNCNTYTCGECGAVKTEKREFTTIDECHELAKRSIKISDASGEVVFEHTAVEIWQTHSYISRVELHGETCEDGYTVYRTCELCGYEDSHYSSGHYDSIVETETIDLAEHGFCGGILHIRTCPCGLVRDDNFEHSEGSCSFSWNSNQDVYTEKEDGSGYILTRNMHCHNCDAERVETRDVTYYSADSCEAYVIETNVYRNADGDQFIIKNEFDDYNHNVEQEYTLLGDDCEDGVLFREICRHCNRTVNEYTYYEHRTFGKETVVLPDTTCGGQIGIRACLCGEESYYYEDTNCRWEYYGYDDISKESKRICYECNAVKTEKYEYTEIDECHESAKRSITISNASGEVIVDRTFEYVNTNHTYVYSAELHGETCEDGYTVYRTCELCGYEDSYVSYGHYDIMIEQDTVDLSEHGFCGGIIHIRTCPCGLVRDEEYTDSMCIWSGDYQEDITTEKSDGSGYIRTRTMHCDNCDAERTETQDVTYKNDYNCEVTVVETNTFRNADGEEFTTSRSFDGGGWHINKRTYEMLGESCEDGVTYKDICSHCGQITLEETYYNHISEYNEIIELPDTTCGGYYGINSCVCGEEAGYYSNTRCNWQSTGYDSDTDTRSYTCSKCGATKTERDIPSETQDPCYYFNQRHITILDSDGTTVLDRVFDDKGTNHDYFVVSSNAEGGNCENGFTVVLQCDKCGKTLTKIGNSHQTFVTKIDLSPKGACEGTYLEVRACACGSEESANVYMDGCNTQYYNSEIQTNDDGTVSWSDTIVCRDCGLRREYTYVGEREDGSCEITGTVNGVISLNDAVIYEDTHDFSEKKHESIHYIYEEGLSCTDGIEYQEVCDRCNETLSRGRVSDHSMMRVVEEIDLGECGAACGGKLTVKSCLCGERQYARLENGDYCDFDRQYCEPWVDDAIESHDRYNAEYDHNEYIGSDAYDMVCAVSDPQPCGFRIRVADYWRAVPDNPCLLQNVQIWRIGYDNKTDTCQREITVLGRIVSEHDFTLTEENTVNDSGQDVNVTTRICKNCDTTVTHETIRQNVDGSSFIIKETHTFINGLDNDDLDKAYTKTSERVVHGTHTHETLDREDTTYKNGGEYWSENSYTYNFDECTRNYEKTNSNGYHSAGSEEYHCLEYPYTTIKEPTCSQFGESLYSECLNCGKQNKEQILPTQHNWRFDSDRGIYYCNYCDLESVTGANGSIVMEDLTASHGNETDFVIGYWNRNDIPVSYYVSVVLNELGEDAENDRVLNDIAFTELNREEDGITAISFAKEDTLNKAKELVESLNYSGSYDIRFTFVPQYDDTTLDYAITLTGVTE